jgi:hypothetical protein
VICSNCGGKIESKRIVIYLDIELMEDVGIPVEPLCEACNQSKKEEDYRTCGKISIEVMEIISSKEKERLEELINTIAENWPSGKDDHFIARNNEFLVFLQKFGNSEMLSLAKITQNGSSSLMLLLNDGKTSLDNIDATISETEEIIAGVLPLLISL